MSGHGARGTFHEEICVCPRMSEVILLYLKAHVGARGTQGTRGTFYESSEGSSEAWPEGPAERTWKNNSAEEA